MSIVVESEKPRVDVSVFEKQRVVRRKKGLPRLLEIAGTKSILLVFAGLFSIIAVIAQMTPFITVYLMMRELIQNITMPAHINTGYIRQLAWITAAGIAAFGVLTYTGSMLSHIAAFNILYEIRLALAAKLGRLGMGYFTRRHTGGIKKVLHEDVERIELFVAHHIVDLVQAISLPVIALVFLFVLDWRLALGVLIPLPAAFIAQFSMYNKNGQNLYTEWQERLKTMNGTIVEYVRGMQVVKVFNQTVSAFKRFKEDVSAYRDLTFNWMRSASNAFAGFSILLGSAAVFIVPMVIIILRSGPVPDYGSFVSSVFLFLYIGMGISLPLFKLMFMSSYLMQVSTGLAGIDEILDHREIENTGGSGAPSRFDIEFRHVSFSYGEHEVLHDISFTVPQGGVTALVGPSGGGKTTIANLTGRFWDIDTGEILIGGINIKDFPVEELNRTVSTVFQDVFLFFDTIEANIRMGNSACGFEEVQAAAKAAQIHDFIESLPQGYKTMIGEGGTYLSGGEQQRIALARAVLKDSPIVLLDEATAYSDPENEIRIQEALSRVLMNKTVIVIAHRLYTIRDVDQVLVIHRGRIEESGTHARLLEKGGLYKKMWEIHARARNWDLGKEKVDD
ncbi:MAG: ABC transporter ATP-binding protein [Spirochaetales bacterium]|nr:ABC transporter ATP-binding protein [Spirochaetales bacterium]